MPRVASFGSVNVDRVANVNSAALATLCERYDWFPAPGETRRMEAVPDAVDEFIPDTLLGGKGANQAVAAARAGVDSALYGKVGEDHGAFSIRPTLAGYGVDVGALEVTDGPTGTAYVFVGPDGENHIAVLAGANAAVDPAYAHAHVEAIRRVDVLLIQNEVPLAATETLFTALTGQYDRPTVVLDPAPAEGVAPLLGYACVDVVTPNETEAAALAPDLAAFDGVVAYKHGPDPVVVETPEERFAVAPPAAAAVDTTGAGDVFAGYLGAELARGTELRTAVEWAVAAASLSVEREGVQPAVPDRAEAEARQSRA